MAWVFCKRGGLMSRGGAYGPTPTFGSFISNVGRQPIAVVWGGNADGIRRLSWKHVSSQQVANQREYRS